MLLHHSLCVWKEECLVSAAVQDPVGLAEVGVHGDGGQGALPSRRPLPVATPQEGLGRGTRRRFCLEKKKSHACIVKHVNKAEKLFFSTRHHSFSSLYFFKTLSTTK